MTANQKANEIYDKYYGELYTLHSLRPRIAKQCALYLVELILELPVCFLANELEKNNPEFFEIEGTEDFWQEVKNQIELL